MMNNQDCLGDHMRSESVSIIGVDCATVPSKRGVAVARFTADHCQVESVAVGLTDEQIASLVAEQIACSKRSLIALDAPLGWPTPMGEVLASHMAGDHLGYDANRLFRRATDRHIKVTYNKQPLDVGADRIARTAHSALMLLAEIAARNGMPIPLAWDENFAGVAAIEVYPAATLIAHGLSATGYKKPTDHEARKLIVKSLPKSLIVQNVSLVEQNVDALDAVLCVLAGVDFLRGEACSPEPSCLDGVRKEGWIWVKDTEG